MPTYPGSCHCGKIAIELSADEMPKGARCWCGACKKISSWASYNIIAKDGQMAVTRGEPKVYQDTTSEPPATISRFFCADCSTGTHTMHSAQPSMVFVKVGMLDDAAKIQPFMDKDHNLAWPFQLSLEKEKAAA